MSRRQTARNRALFDRVIFGGETLQALAQEHRLCHRTIQRLVLDEAERRGYVVLGGVSAVRKAAGGKGYVRAA